MQKTYDSAPIGGLCSGMPIEIWFPVVKKGGANRAERLERLRLDEIAFDTCSRCEKTLHCLEYSLLHEPFGIWGGMNESERAKLRDKRGIMIEPIFVGQIW